MPWPFLLFPLPVAWLAIKILAELERREKPSPILIPLPIAVLLARALALESIRKPEYVLLMAVLLVRTLEEPDTIRKPKNVLLKAVLPVNELETLESRRTPDSKLDTVQFFNVTSFLEVMLIPV